MKLVTFAKSNQKDEGFIIGALLENHSVVNLQPAAALFLQEKEKEKKPYPKASQLIPADMGSFLGRGAEAMNLASLTVGFILQSWPQEKRRSLQGLNGE